MPARNYYIFRDGKRIDGADRMCDIRSLQRYHARRPGALVVKTWDGVEVDA